MRFFLITVLLLANSLCFSQRHNIYFLKNNGVYLPTRDSADYIRIVSEPDSGTALYNVAEYYINSKPKRLGKSSAIDPPVFEGICTEFYKNGKRQSVANYKKGSVLGLEYDYYPNGKLYLTKNYRLGDEADFSNSQILAEYDSTGVALVVDSNGYYKGYDSKFKQIVDEGRVKNGNRDGLWKGTDPGLRITFKEVYDNGKLISGTSFSHNGDSINYTGSRNAQPKFKNNPKAFITFLSNNVSYPDYDKAHNIQGRVILTFVVEKDGSLSDIKVLKSVSPTLDAEAIRVLKESKRWIPGTMYGRPVRVQYLVPFAFALTN